VFRQLAGIFRPAVGRRNPAQFDPHAVEPRARVRTSPVLRLPERKSIEESGDVEPEKTGQTWSSLCPKAMTFQFRILLTLSAKPQPHWLPHPVQDHLQAECRQFSCRDGRR
jgi:hypothetical protein